jgi:hypothetical protein
VSRDSLLKIVAALGIAVAALHAAAVAFLLYWTIWWYDITLHFIGGLWVSLGIVWLAYFSGYLPLCRRSNVRIFAVTLIWTFVVGVAWEVFEYLMIGANIWAPEGYWFDTIGDLLSDIAGGLCGYIIFMRLDSVRDN